MFYLVSFEKRENRGGAQRVGGDRESQAQTREPWGAQTCEPGDYDPSQNLRPDV